MNKLLFTFCFLISIVFTINAQKVNVGLDNWFNNETNSKTGLPYHYIWADSSWSGYSQWGQIFVEKGATINIVKEPTKKNLSSIDVYIIVDPDSTSETSSPIYITKEYADAIEKWVKAGGVLLLMANDAKNCEFTYLNQLASRFGLFFNPVSLHKVPNKQWDMGAFTSFPDHPLFKGLSKIYLKEISTITLSGNAKSVLTEDGNVFMAESTAGKGFVIAIGDPWIYNEYIHHDRLPEDFENYKAAENLSEYLIKLAK